MSRKPSTIELTCCDFCESEHVTVWTCSCCKKEACVNHCHVYDVAQRRPKKTESAFAIPMPTAGDEPKLQWWTLVACTECESKVQNDLERAGFQNGFAEYVVEHQTKWPAMTAKKA